MNIEEHQIVTELVEELEDVFLNDLNHEWTTKIGLTTFLRSNQDVFAWSHEDMPEIDPSVMVHRVNVSPSFLPIRKKKRVFTSERDRAIVEEVCKLQEASFIREVYYPD